LPVKNTKDVFRVLIRTWLKRISAKKRGTLFSAEERRGKKKDRAEKFAPIVRRRFGSNP